MRTPTKSFFARPIVAAPLAALAFALVLACGGTPGSPGGSGTDPASSSPAASPTPTGPEPIVFTEDGTGPYTLGTTFDSLNGAGLLDEVTTGGELCAQNTRARGTGDYTDVRLSFRPDGLLYLVSNRSEGIPTVAGAHLGNNLAELTALYPTNTDLSQGPFVSILVSAPSGNGILFDLGMDDELFAMHAAEAAWLQSSVEDGTDFC